MKLVCILFGIFLEFLAFMSLMWMLPFTVLVLAINFGIFFIIYGLYAPSDERLKARPRNINEIADARERESEVSLGNAPSTSSGNSNLLMVGGVLGIIAGCVSVVLCMLTLRNAFNGTFSQSSVIVGKDLLVGALGFWAFIAGLASGQLAIKRKKFVWPTIGIGILILFSVIATLVSPDLVASRLSISAACLAFLSIIVITVARRKFGDAR